MPETALLFFVHPPELICRFSQSITFSTVPREPGGENEAETDFFLVLSVSERRRGTAAYVHTYFQTEWERRRREREAS